MSCPAQIEVDGRKATCELENGPEHNPPTYAHKAEIDRGDGTGVIVEWSYWREVKPPRI